MRPTMKIINNITKPDNNDNNKEMDKIELFPCCRMMANFICQEIACIFLGGNLYGNSKQVFVQEN